MSCKVINKKFNLFSCNKEDIENEWMDVQADDNIDTSIIAFYNPQTDKLIIVEDARHFEMLKLVAEGYLSLSNEQRDKFHNNHIPKSIEGFMNVLKEAINIREKRRKKEEIQGKVKSLRKILDHQYYAWDVISEVSEMFNSRKPENEILTLMDIYNYGVIQGKRAERAKKKKSQIGLTA